MLVINYNGNKPTTDYFKFSVQGNNKSDVVRFIVSLNQGGFVFDDNYHYYAKVQCVDDDYYDKIAVDTWGVNDNLNLFTADLILKAQTTSHKQIEISLSCENLQDEIVWQTQIVKIAIANGVNADEQIADQYPSVLQDLQEQIDELKQGGGGGSYKTIFLELMPSIACENDEDGYRGNLRLNLINFDSSDVGSYIYLYNKSLGNKQKKNGRAFFTTRKMTYKHPTNWDSETTNIAKLGYGVFANKRMKYQGDWIWDDVPTFMYHNGYVQTEYEITEQHINQGYMDIDVGKEFLQLLIPYVNDGNNYDDNKIVFGGRVATFGKTQFITYYQIKNGKIACYPKNSLVAYPQGRGDLYDFLGVDDDGDYRLKQTFTIKILPY